MHGCWTSVMLGLYVQAACGSENNTESYFLGYSGCFGRDPAASQAQRLCRRNSRRQPLKRTEDRTCIWTLLMSDRGDLKNYSIRWIRYNLRKGYHHLIYNPDDHTGQKIRQWGKIKTQFLSSMYYSWEPWNKRTMFALSRMRWCVQYRAYSFVLAGEHTLTGRLLSGTGHGDANNRAETWLLGWNVCLHINFSVQVNYCKVGASGRR